MTVIMASEKIKYERGESIGRLIYLYDVAPLKDKRKAMFICKCGNKFVTQIYHAKSEETKSCGCLNLNSPPRLSHGDSRKSHYHYYLYTLWIGIRVRCYCKSNKAYHCYGERGIKMYEPWMNDYLLFKKWILENLGERPQRHSLDRIKNNGDYEPNNLRWATQSQQVRNSRWVKLTKDDIIKIKIMLATNMFKKREIGERFNTHSKTIYDIENGMSYNDIIITQHE